MNRIPFVTSFLRHFDAEARSEDIAENAELRTDWLRITPYIGIHLMCFGVIWVGWSSVAVGVAGFLYLLRIFAITGFYHRYFSHRTFKTSRWFQFLFGLIGTASIQRGPLWWAAHHRHHHAHSDDPEDVHSPVQHGFLWSHMGWFTAPVNFPTKIELIQDFAKFPELRFLDRFDLVIAVLIGTGMFILGASLPAELGTSGMQMLVWFFISTVTLYHVTYMINSLAHVYGSRRYETTDTSRNNPFLAILAFGEGWHNNHHHYPNTARQGFYWWEIDMSYYIIVALSWLGLVWDVKPLPAEIREPKEEKVADIAASRRVPLSAPD
jgi:stearoyl-CoA desaturase (delta-9 desaturase)